MNGPMNKSEIQRYTPINIHLYQVSPPFLYLFFLRSLFSSPCAAAGKLDSAVVTQSTLEASRTVPMLEGAQVAKESCVVSIGLLTCTKPAKCADRVLA